MSPTCPLPTPTLVFLQHSVPSQPSRENRQRTKAAEMLCFSPVFVDPHLIDHGSRGRWGDGRREAAVVDEYHVLELELNVIFTRMPPPQSDKCSPVDVGTPMSQFDVPAHLPSMEGEVEFIVPSAGKICKTWYKVVGDLHSPTSRRPLVALHGGPGVNHAYLLILSDLTKAHSIPLVVYDQIGSGNSTHLPEKIWETTFWTEQLFLNQLDSLLAHLGIQDDYDLLGHSWGGMFGSRHAAGGPTGLKHLVLASTPASMDLWMEAQNALRAKLPRKIRNVLDKHEREGTTDSEEYNAAVGQFFARHLCRLDPLPAPIVEGFEASRKDRTVGLTMTGPSQFEAGGTLKHWSMVADAHRITMPTLLTSGLYDQAQDSVLKPFMEAITRVKRVKFMESSHMAHFEEREEFMRVVGSFLVDKFRAP
ncbi:Alpha/Beta hydrolase protein [Mycena polygramma]|nr:Alpha/Beta hydrolase protein [Mycena polygramma]